MKKLYRMFRRGNRYYAEHVETRRQTGLGTSDHAEAVRLWAAKKEAAQSPRLNLALARAYLGAHDQRMVERTWRGVMTEMVARAKPKSQARYDRAVREAAFDPLRDRTLIETTAEDFIAVLRAGTKSTNHFLRRLHNLALGLAWLPAQVLTSKLWPTMSPAVRRGITLAEHRLIINSEKNEERRHYYELLWETGGSQTDIVNLRAENILWDQGILCYSRCKLKPSAPPSQLAIGPPAGGTPARPPVQRAAVSKLVNSSRDVARRRVQPPLPRRQGSGGLSSLLPLRLGRTGSGRRLPRTLRADRPRSRQPRGGPVLRETGAGRLPVVGAIRRQDDSVSRTIWEWAGGGLR